MKTTKKMISFLLVLAMAASFMPAVFSTASAESASYQLADLLTEGKIKPLGRTAVNPDKTGIMCDWPGNGFQMNVSGNGGKLEIVVSTNYAANWVVLCDDTQVYWERLASAGGTISATIPAGDHLISVIKESDNEGKESNYCDLTTMTFEGTIASRPADKDLVIEYIGDSYTAGWGTLGTYKPGRSWTGYEHSFIHGYAYYMSENLNADYMIAARGGIGLFDGVSAEQPDDDPKATILDIYPYTAGFRTSAGLYQFDRKADIVIVELGANDSIKADDANFTADKWEEALEAMTDMARAGHPDAAIVFLSHKAPMQRIMRKVCEERKDTDPNLYFFGFAHQGNGSGGSTQYYGHPNAEDSERLADALTAFVVERGLTGSAPKAPAPTYTDYVYYATATGNDSNAGTSLDTAKLTLTGALKQAKADRTYAKGDRIVVNVEGTVKINPGSSQYLANVGDILLPDGSDVPVLVQTNNFSGTKAILDTNHNPSDNASGMVYFCHSITLKDITFQATTGASTFRDSQLYAGYNDVAFDNVTFALTGATTTSSASWSVNATHVIGSVAIPEGGNSSITFRNGDYTNITATAVYRANMVSTSVTNAPTVHTKVIIEDGAIMKNLYNRWGELGLGSSTVEIRGGTVQTYFGTVNSPSANYSNYLGDVNFVMSGGTVNKFVGTYTGSTSVPKTIEGNVNFTMTGGNIGGTDLMLVGYYADVTGNVTFNMSGGKIDGTNFMLVGNNADVTGNVTFNMSGGDINSNHFYVVGQNSTVSGALTSNVSGGIIEIRPTADYNTINFGGRLNCTLGSVTNNISGGQFLIVADAVKSGTTGYISGIYMGGVSNCTITGNVTNNITGGSFLPMSGKVTGGYAAVNFGVLSGAIKGGLYNNIIGGTFEMGNTGSGGYVFGAYSDSTPVAKIVNVFGDKDSWQGPMFKGSVLHLGGNAGAIGVTTKPTALPAASECSDEVVISSTFYNGYFSSHVYGGPVTAESSSKFNFVKGSIELNIYGGQLNGTVYSAGTTDVYGKVTTNLNGGHVANLYAAGNNATVYDGAELNIREGFEEYHDVSKTNAWHFWGGSYAANVPAPQTAGRPSVKITVSAEDSSKLILKTPIEARCAGSKTIQGAIDVQIAGGTYPEGFAVGGTTVNAALAEGYILVDTSTGTKLTYADTETTSGDTSVTVIAEADWQEPVIPEKYIATVQNGQITAYATTVSELTKAVAPSGNSVITLHEDINYDGTIVFPYSCTLDFNGHTVVTNQTTGNGIQIEAAGSQNKVTTVKNGTLLHFEVGLRINAGGIIVENMTIRSKSGAPVGLYETSAEFKDINRVTNCTLSSGLYGAIVFNKKNADFSETGIRVERSVLISEKADGSSTINKQYGTTAGTITFGTNVELYTYASSCITSTAVVAGQSLTKTTNQSVTVCDTTFTGMNKWSTPGAAAYSPDTDSSYDTLSDAMAALSQTGGTVTLLKNLEETVVTVRNNITLDLNGKNLSTNYFTCYGSVTDGLTGGTSLLQVSGNIHIADTSTSFLPIYDTAAGGYRFYKYELQNLGAKTAEDKPNTVKFGFRLVLANTAGYNVLATTSDEALDTFAQLIWGDKATPLTYQFKDATLKSYAQQAGADIAANGTTGKAVVLTVAGTDVLESDTVLQVENTIVSLPGVTAKTSPATWTTP